MSDRGRLVALWLPPVVLMVAIFGFSSMPSGENEHGIAEAVLRKGGHFAGYALLAASWWRALSSRLDARAALAAAFLLTVAYAASDELHQTFVDERIGTPVDVLLDAVGAASALVLISRRRVAARA